MDTRVGLEPTTNGLTGLAVSSIEQNPSPFAVAPRTVLSWAALGYAPIDVSYQRSSHRPVSAPKPIAAAIASVYQVATNAAVCSGQCRP